MAESNSHLCVVVCVDVPLGKQDTATKSDPVWNKFTKRGSLLKY